MHCLGIDVLKQPTQLFDPQFNDRLLPMWPDEAVFLKAPEHQSEASSVVDQYSAR